MAAAMLPLQLPLCVCGSEGHSHADSSQPERCQHDAMPVESHDHSHQAGHSHDTDHSHGSGNHHGSGDSAAAPAPASGGHSHDDSTPCECSPQKVPMGPLPKSENVDSLERQFCHWLSQAAHATLALVRCKTTLSADCQHFRSGTNLIIASQGNPCALLCRWVT
jgi:hypothetical protein